MKFLAFSVLALFAVPAAAQTTLNAGLSGTVTLSELTPVPGSQRFTLTGGFTSYSASPNLPQINGGDLAAYSFTVTGLSSSFDAASRTVVYSNVTGTINGYGQVVQNLAPTDLTVTFAPDFGTAVVFGRLFSTGSVTPPGFPGPIDFSPANGALIRGIYTSTGPGGGTFAGSLAFPAVPEPATWAMMIGGFGMAGASMRRRRAVPATILA